jgi:hypothetical protein
MGTLAISLPGPIEIIVLTGSALLVAFVVVVIVRNVK